MAAEPHEALDTAYHYIETIREALEAADAGLHPHHEARAKIADAKKMLDLQENWLLSGLARSWERGDNLGDYDLPQSTVLALLLDSDRAIELSRLEEAMKPS